MRSKSKRVSTATPDPAHRHRRVVVIDVPPPHPTVASDPRLAEMLSAFRTAWRGRQEQTETERVVDAIVGRAAEGSLS
ncbi:MAG: hypothetical protein KJO43_00975, partial [Phycisphaerae bacterium]|nr:hypothetical protein [Phycisphaerae bacterium]